MFNIKREKAFTLAEVIIVCSLFSLMVIWIIVAINRAYIFLDNTRLAVRASNLARGWVEMVYNLRDTNWRKYSWERDGNRLNLWSWAGSMGVWVYTINEATNSSGNSFIYLENISVPDVETFYSIDWFFSDAYSWQREKSKLDFTGTYSYYTWWTIATWWIIKDLIEVDGLEFYRVARIFDIVNKNSCTSTDCPQEVRFCVRVFYESQWRHSIELCSIMTNFME